MIDVVIDVKNLSKQYRNKKFKTVSALRDLTLQVHTNKIFGFLGPNGAGKSTTIKILMGLLRPTSGMACLYGTEVKAPASRLRVGYLPENPSFYDFLTAYEYLSFVGSTFGMDKKKCRRESDRVLSLLDLQAAAKRPIRGYSKGMVQRLGLAQALLHDPDLYILDEPMSGLDPLGRALVKDIMLDLKERGKTVFFSTHVTADVERVCDRIGVIAGGVFRDERQVSELLREGVEGYYCRIRYLDKSQLQGQQIVDCGDGTFETFVLRSDFDELSFKVLQNGGSFDLIEPRRRDVEDYFLKLVADSKADQ